MDTSESYYRMCYEAFPEDREQGNVLKTQDQLQEMMVGHGYEYSSGFGGLQESYHRFVDRTVLTDNISSIFGTIPEYQYCQSWEQLWLAFVMKERYSKTWKGQAGGDFQAHHWQGVEAPEMGKNG